MPGTNLTRDEAQQRAAHIATQSYAVELDLTTAADTFRSVTTARFTSSAPGSETFVDLIAPSVESITLKDSVAMDNSSDDACQGATFTVPVKVTALSAA